MKILQLQYESHQPVKTMPRPSLQTFIASLFLLLILLFTAGCSLYPQDNYTELVVVESYLITGEPLAEVRISRTLPVFEEYSFEKAALNDANVVITEISPTGDLLQTHLYEAKEPGIYTPADPSVRVKPSTRYNLSVTFDNRDEEIRATTTTPAQIQIVNEIPEIIQYQSEEQFTLLVDPGSYSEDVLSGMDGQETQHGEEAHHGQATTTSTAPNVTFIINTIAQDTLLENLTPFYRNLYDEVEDIEFSELQVNSSGLLNEANFGRNTDGLIELQYPWLAVVFLGQNEVVIHSVDENTNLFLRSQSVQLGGSTLPPGEIPNITYRVDGGIGIFGSSATDTARIQVQFFPG